MPPPAPPPPPYTAVPPSSTSNLEPRELSVFEEAAVILDIQRQVANGAASKQREEMAKDLRGVERRLLSKMDAVMGKMRRMETTVTEKMQRMESTVAGKAQMKRSVVKEGNAGEDMCEAIGLFIAFIVAVAMLGFIAGRWW